jgi:Ni/Co efflux regulator RcnB
MIRTLISLALAAALTVPALAQDSAKAKAAKAKAAAEQADKAKSAAQDARAKAESKGKAKATGKTDAKTDAKADAKAEGAEPKGKGKGKGATAAAPGGGKPLLVATFGDWGAYTSQGAKGKICYALAQPRERQPASLKRDAGYVFISTRPGEGVRGEISIMMGFPLKEGASGGVAEVGATSFALVAKGENAWVKNAAEESQLAEAMRKGAKLVVKAPSVKGNQSTDTYSLSGLGQALERVQKDCQ